MRRNWVDVHCTSECCLKCNMTALINTFWQLLASFLCLSPSLCPKTCQCELPFTTNFTSVMKWKGTFTDKTCRAGIDWIIRHFTHKNGVRPEECLLKLLNGYLLTLSNSPFSLINKTRFQRKITKTNFFLWNNAD